MVVKMYQYIDGESLPLAATPCAATLSSGDTPQRPEFHQPGHLSPSAAQSLPSATTTHRKMSGRRQNGPNRCPSAVLATA